MDLPLPVRIHSHHLLPGPNLEQVGRTGKRSYSCHHGIKTNQSSFFVQPTITSLESTNHPVWEIDFPGVTVCPTTKVSRLKVLKLVQEEPWRSSFSASNDGLYEALESLAAFETNHRFSGKLRQVVDTVSHN